MKNISNYTTNLEYSEYIIQSVITTKNKKIWKLFIENIDKYFLEDLIIFFDNKYLFPIQFIKLYFNYFSKIDFKIIMILFKQYEYNQNKIIIIKLTQRG